MPYPGYLKSFLNVKEILRKNLVHGEHVNSVCLEDSPHSIIAADLSLVVRVLEAVGFHVLPYPFHSLGSRKLVKNC